MGNFFATLTKIFSMSHFLQKINLTRFQRSRSQNFTKLESSVLVYYRIF